MARRYDLQRALMPADPVGRITVVIITTLLGVAGINIIVKGIGLEEPFVTKRHRACVGCMVMTLDNRPNTVRVAGKSMDAISPQPLRRTKAIHAVR